MDFVGPVGVDSHGKLGTMLVDANGNKVSISSLLGIQPQSVPQSVPKRQAPATKDAHQAMLNRKVEALEATVAQLTAQLKEQAAQIQKVSAQLEVSKPAPQVVVNKP